MNSVIFKGVDALAAAKDVQTSGLGSAFDLGPDFGQPTARVYLPEHTLDGPQRWIAFFENARDVRHWFDTVGTNFQVVYDAPPYSMGGVPSTSETQL